MSAVAPGGQAARTGKVFAGDRVVTVNGIRVMDMGNREAARLVLAETTVTFELLDGFDRTRARRALLDSEIVILGMRIGSAAGPTAGVPVLHVSAGGQAERAGIKGGDEIMSINGSSCMGMSNVDAAKLITAQIKIELEVVSGPC